MVDCIWYLAIFVSVTWAQEAQVHQHIMVDVVSTSVSNVTLFVHNKVDPAATVKITATDLQDPDTSSSHDFKGLPGNYTVTNLEPNKFYGFMVRTSGKDRDTEWSSVARQVAETRDKPYTANELRQIEIIPGKDEVVLRAVSDKVDNFAIQLQLQMDCPDKYNRKSTTITLDKDHKTAEQAFSLGSLVTPSEGSSGDEQNAGNQSFDEKQHCEEAHEAIWIKPNAGDTSYRLLRHTHYVDDLVGVKINERVGSAGFGSFGNSGNGGARVEASLLVMIGFGVIFFIIKLFRY